MIVTAYCKFVRASEYNGQPQMIFHDIDKDSWGDFSVSYQPGMFSDVPLSDKPYWFKFRADEYKFAAKLREFLGYADQ